MIRSGTVGVSTTAAVVVAGLCVLLVGLVAGPDAAAAGARGVRYQEASPEVLDRGRELYVGQCQSCHGREGKGDGPASRFVDPPPRDLTAGEWMHVEAPTVEEIVRVVTSGIDETDMLPFAELMTEEEILAVATYVHDVIIASDGEGGR